MRLVSAHSTLSGAVRIPASKSHTIRALLIASMAEGRSELIEPLASGDTLSCLAACEAFGASITKAPDRWIVESSGALRVPDDVVNTGNSGTTLYLAMGAAALCNGATVFTGDYQIRRRPAQELIGALGQLGAHAFSTRGNGCAPIVVSGPMKGGRAALSAPTSQYLSSLLLACPCAQGDTAISLSLVNEIPYVEMTLDWLSSQGIRFDRADDFRSFHIPGGQRYRPFVRAIPGDFSSATFFLVAAAITGSDVTLHGLDLNDKQGDKAVIGMLRAMGARIDAADDGIRVRGGALHGCELDLNATPDALPALAVAGCFAGGETRLVNVAHARNKETDRIAVMKTELERLGADISELPDGLVIRHRPLRGGSVHGHDDHRVVMACAVAGLRCAEPVVVDTAEAMEITFPLFVALMRSLGGNVARETR
ncbi:3-phosphoshikimate 1-carboxyvinyltransferase [bacterium]|nr:3-phosphoshikimate 1-carboxyvinyltransferase [bacterium]